MTQSIGLSIDHEWIDGQIGTLKQVLRVADELEIETIELRLGALNWIRGGHLVPAEVERAQALLSEYSFQLALHVPNELRLTRNPMHLQVMDAVLELASTVGAGLIVYHSAQIALDDAYRSLSPLPTDEQIRELWSRETELLVHYGEQAADQGIALAVENRDPHLWEISALASHGKDALDLARYHQGMRLDLLTKQIESVGLPNVGMCLDVGHAYLAKAYWPNDDFLQAVEGCAVHVNHVHVHDNFGLINDLAPSLADRLVFGEADNHLPPGWGTIPLLRVLETLAMQGYSGALVLEIRPRYFDYLEEAVGTLHQIVQEANGESKR